MGAICGCLRNGDFANSNGSIFGNCTCLGCFTQNFLLLYASLFHRGGEHTLPSATQGTAISSMASLDNYSTLDTYHSPPRPLPFDTDPRYFRSQPDVLDSQRERGSSHLNEETEPLRKREADECSESLTTPSKWKEFSREEGSKEYSLKSSLKLLSAKTMIGFAHTCNSSEDEDLCPTCLEEYTTENPKILTKCSHHFHLGCIYEWMERSDACPVCGKVMAFDETT